MDSLSEKSRSVILPSVTLEHGERYGMLTVLRKRGHRYSVGCECGWRFKVSARKLMKGEVKACLKCRHRSPR